MPIFVHLTTEHECDKLTPTTLAFRIRTYYSECDINNKKKKVSSYQNQTKVEEVFVRKIHKYKQKYTKKKIY